MLVELIFKNRLLISGTVKEVRLRLAEHSRNYILLKELIDEKRP